MFCERCGSLLEDGAAFCAKCGTPVTGAGSASVEGNSVNAGENGVNAGTSVANTEQTAQPFVSPAYTMPTPSAMPQGAPAPKQKKFPVIALILGIIAALAAVVLIVVAINFSAISNAVRRNFSSPQNYYKYVEKKTVEDMSAAVGEWYDSYMFATAAEDTRVKSKISVEVNEAGQSILSLANLLTGVDGTWFESGTITMESALKDGVAFIEGSISLNDQNIISGNVISDTQNHNVYFQIPEWTQTYLGVDTADIEDEDDFREQVALEEQLMEAMPDKETVERLTGKYLSLILDCVEDVTKDKDVLEVSDVSQNVDVLTVTMDEDDIQGILETVFGEMEKDAEIREIIVGIAQAVDPDIDEDEAYESFLDEFESEVEDFDEYFWEYTDRTLVMRVYVDKTGIIRGREILWTEDVSAYGSDWTNSMTVSVRMPKKGNQFGYELEIFRDMEKGYGEDVRIKISGDGRRSGDTFDGDFDVSYNKAKILKITLKEVDAEKWEKGQLDGTVEVSLADSFGTLFGFEEMSEFEGIRFVLVGEESDREEDITFDIFLEDESLVTIKISSQIEDGAGIEMPAEEDVIMAQDAEDMMEWIEEVDWDEVISRLEDTDLPDSIIYIIEDYISDLTGSSYYDYYNYTDPYYNMWSL